MNTSWRYFWDFIDSYEQSLWKSYEELAAMVSDSSTLEKLHLNIESKLELIKLLRNYFRD